MELVLVRHADAWADEEARRLGEFDAPLSDRGRVQCARLAVQLREEPIQVVVSSPLQRARSTADAIADAHGLAVELIDDLREIDFGELEGLTYEQVEALWPELFAQLMQAPTTVRFPRGESYQDLRRRVATVTAGLRRRYEGELVVAVTHGGVIRAALADALGMPDGAVFRFAVDTASVTRLAWLESGVLVRSINFVT